MSNDKYKKYINEMIASINDERDLKQIYTIVHRKFIKRTINDQEIAPAQK